MSLDQGDKIVKFDVVTKDAFLGGEIHLLQPKSGFRAGTDSVLLGASVAETSMRVLDLGAGIGAASLCALARLKEARAHLVELNPGYRELAAQNVINNNFSDRAETVSLDVSAPGAEREAAGIKPDHFTSVIANPPYFDASAGTSAPQKARAGARAMPQDDLDKWVRTAASAAAPEGEIIFIYRASGLTELLNAFTRFGAVSVLPIAARPGEEAGRVLVRGIKGSRAPLVIKPPLVLHDETGNDFTLEMSGILRQGAALHW